MKLDVRENSEKRLLVHMAPGGCGLIGGSAVFILMGLVVIWFLGSRITFEISADRVEYRNSVLGLYLKKEFVLPRNQVSEAEIGLSEVGISRTYKVALNVGQEQFLCDFPGLDGDGKRDKVSEINGVLASPEEVYRFEESMIIPGMFLGGGCILGGLICLYFLQRASFLADRNLGVIQVKKRRLLLPMSSKSVIPLSNFKRIKEKKVSVHRGGVETSSYKLLLEHKEGDPVSLSYGPMFTKGSSKEMCRLIHEWQKKR